MVATEPLKVVGTRPIRPDGVDKVTGRATYGADIKLPGMLYARVKRSPHAHARIKRIDASKALALPGVKAVVTRADFRAAPEGMVDLGEGQANLKYMLDNVCADDKVFYRGHAVAAVAATDLHIAEDALALIEVEYEPLPPVMHVRDAMTDGAPILHEDLRTAEMISLFEPPAEGTGHATNVASHMRLAAGDIDAGFAEAEVIIEREFETSMAHQGYIEPQNATVLWNKDDDITVWTSTQGPFSVRSSLAALLDHPVSRIRVMPMEIGGGFGGKIPIYLEPYAALLSKKTGGAPVKMWMTREEVLEGTGPTSGTYMRAKLGAKRDGTIVAAQVYLAFEAGAFPGSPVGAGVMCAVAPYTIPNVQVDGYDVVVNRPKVAAYRGPGAPQAEFAVESVIDELAEQLDIDPIDLRLKNAATEGDRRADGVVFGPIGNVAVLQAIKDSPHYRSELQGENRGRGVAIGFWFNVGFESAAYASVNVDGTVALSTGSPDIGGTRAAHAMQLAEALGIPYEDVRPHVVDTDSIGYTNVTGGSRTAFAGGWAAYEAAMDIARQLEARAALIWEIDPASARYADGMLFGPDGKSMTFKEIATQLPHTGGMVQGRASVNPTEVGPSFAGHICDVEVDPDTGKVQVLRYTAVQDVGRAVHPSYVEGQMQGGASQGIGMALNEEYFYDENGVMRNSSFLDYRMPTSLDLPMIDTILVEVPSQAHPYGLRGVGEVPIVPPMATVSNAIYHATGLRMRKLPASPRVMLDELLGSEA